jgi:hypothetical protein
VSNQEVEEQSRYVAELFTAIRANQRYGVKMGYVSDDRLGGALLFGPIMQAGMFSSPEEISSTYHPLLDQTDATATVVHTQRKHHQRIKVERYDAYGHTTAGFSGLGPSAVLFLGGEGELYTWRDCKVSLRDIAVQKGKYKAYRDLQASVIAHYFDLTHRLEDVARINRTLRERPSQVTPGTPRALESIARLVVPRVKWYDEKVIPDAADSPMETAEEESVRSVRRHNVTWHIRQLPEGWRPSPAALELAEKMGVTLGQNETIVKEHKRGVLELGQITSHQFIRRPDPEL